MSEPAKAYGPTPLKTIDKGGAYGPILLKIIDEGGGYDEMVETTGFTRRYVYMLCAKLGRHPKKAVRSQISPRLREEIIQLLHLGYPKEHIAADLAVGDRTVRRVAAAAGIKASPDICPPTLPKDCVHHKMSRTWKWNNRTAWRPYCKKCASITNSKRKMHLANRGQKWMKPLTEAQIAKRYKKRRYEDEPRACRPEPIWRW